MHLMFGQFGDHLNQQLPLVVLSAAHHSMSLDNQLMLLAMELF